MSGWWWALGAALLAGASLRIVGPSLRCWLIACDQAPDMLREFAAATLVHGGVFRTLVHCALVPWARVRLPGWLIAAIGRRIARQQGGDLGELAQPLERYATLDELFTRG